MHTPYPVQPSQLKEIGGCSWHYSFPDSPAEPFHRILPTPDIHMVFHARRSWVKGGLTEGKLSFIGPSARFTLASDLRKLEVIGVRITPGTTRTGFGVEPRSLHQQEIEVGTCCPSLKQFEDELRHQKSAARVLAAMRAMVAKHSALSVNAEQREICKRTAQALRFLQSSQQRISTVASALGTTERTLYRNLISETGLAPKTLARLYRFQHAVAQLARSDRPELALIAAACGYADQAHMCHDFQELAGVPPSQLQ